MNVYIRLHRRFHFSSKRTASSGYTVFMVKLIQNLMKLYQLVCTTNSNIEIFLESSNKFSHCFFSSFFFFKKNFVLEEFALFEAGSMNQNLNNLQHKKLFLPTSLTITKLQPIQKYSFLARSVHARVRQTAICAWLSVSNLLLLNPKLSWEFLLEADTRYFLFITVQYFLFEFLHYN